MDNPPRGHSIAHLALYGKKRIRIQLSAGFRTHIQLFHGCGIAEILYDIPRRHNTLHEEIADFIQLYFAAPLHLYLADLTILEQQKRNTQNHKRYDYQYIAEK